MSDSNSGKIPQARAKSSTDHELVCRYSLRKRKYWQAIENATPQQSPENITSSPLTIDETTPISVEDLDQVISAISDYCSSELSYVIERVEQLVNKLFLQLPTLKSAREEDLFVLYSERTINILIK
ncbi:unnamed protein product [Didymodactylos carnosus]|uniref:Uncharacterized protein n=1 Tax=Didymodactylos carnosus TaxID=1234261 RepID=A0A815HJ23_9BILA|nr:unnamed protein product [Didymodactylos carnosus]CAF1353115.1 unnamed protein product [Didymodactylos carnosus]CAF3563413.1 unnamed protein product [Didymodactylos carnosus]CAF4224758.1 unnamed protein product [Didymodactylos carnosus]